MCVLIIRLFIMCSLFFSVFASAANLPNYTDSWYNANESGWGITITDHDTNAFVQWYTYDQTGHNQKYVIPGGTFSNDKCQFTGAIQHVTGPSWTLPAFDPNQVTRTTAGTGTIDFCPIGLPAGTIVFNYNNVDGVNGSKQLTRLPFGNDVPHWGGTANTGASDFTDLWWNPSESGWGVSVTQHGNNLFFRIFTYDTDKRPLLFVVSGITFNSATSFTGAVTLTSGPWFGTEHFDPNQVTRTTAGTATLTFSDANNGVLSYTVNGVMVTKTITRVAFGNAALACSLTASPTSVTSGGSSTLTASCPTATSYTWTGGTCAGNTTNTCTATPTSTTNYSVTGTNVGGTSATAVATVTVAVTTPASLTCIGGNGGGTYGISFYNPSNWFTYQLSTSSASAPDIATLGWGAAYIGTSMGAYTGSLKAELRAIPSSYSGGTIFGYVLGTFYPNFTGQYAHSSSQIASGGYSSNTIVSSATNRNPPSGKYCVIIALMQYMPGINCSSTDGYCFVDWLQFDSPVTFY